MVREPPNPRRVTTNAMEKLKEAVLRLCSSCSSPLTPYEVEDRLRSLFASSQPLRTPDHPPYSEMIITAITELNERGGSNEESISSFIEANYGDLPFAHPRLLTHHLEKLVKSGEIVSNAKLRYGLPKFNANPNCEKKLLERNGKGKKRSRSYGGKAKPNGGRKKSPLAPLEDLENPVVQYKKYRTDGCGVEEKSKPERLGGQELVLRGDNVRILSADDDVYGSSQFQLANVNGEEHFQEANGLKESHYGAVESVVKDQRVESVCPGNVCVVASQLQLMPLIETEPLQSIFEKQIELLCEQHGEQESVAKTVASIDDDNNYIPEHGTQETLLKDQIMTSASDDNVLHPQLQRMSVIEMEPLQKLNKHNEPLEPGSSNNIHEPEQQLKDQMAALVGEKATYVFQMEQLQLPNNQDEPPPKQQGEKTEKGHRGRPKKKHSVEDHEMQELLVEGHTTTPMGDDNSVLQRAYRHDEQQPLQKPESQQQLEGDLLPKKKDGRGRLKKGEPKFEEQIKVGPLQMKKDGRGRPKKKQPESERQLDVDPLQKKNDGRGRPMKKKLESEQQLEVDPWQKKKDGKGRAKKKKPEIALRVEKQLEVGPLEKIKDGRGRPKKKKPESEQQSEVDPLQKKKDSRGRPKKKKPESVQQLEVEPLQKKKDGRGRPKKKKPESEQQLEVDLLLNKKDSRGRPKKKKPESESQLAVDPLQKKNNGRGSPEKKNPESEQQLAVDPLQKKKDGRGRPKKKIPNFELQGEEQLVLQDEKIVGSVVENDCTSTPLAELIAKRGPGSPNKNKDSVELLEKQQLRRRSLGSPPRKRKESEASNAGVDDGENSLKARNEITGGSLATELVPSQKLDSEMVKEQSMDPPRKKISKTALKRLQEPLLLRRQLRPKHPL